jgi:hypothetical protein
MEFSVTPNQFQAGLPVARSNDPLGTLTQGLVVNINSNTDPLGAMNAQGLLVVIDTKTDPLGALNSPSIVPDMNPETVNGNRINAKMLNAFSLGYAADPGETEQMRANNLRVVS